MDIKIVASVELDPVFRQALKCLHSPNTDAAENIRKALDDVIKQKHGPNKMLINTLSKKYIAEESKATGSGVIKAAVRRSSNKSSDSSSSSPVQIIATTSTTSTTTVITTDSSGQTQEIPFIISLPDSSNSDSIAAVDDNAMDTHIHDILFDDLSCVICGRLDVSAKNRLIECIKCTSLYHQECHNPQIKDSDMANGQESTWCCSNCKVKKFKTSSIGSPSKSHHSSSPTSSSSSNSDVIITGTSSATFGSHSSTSSNSKKDKDKNKEKEKDKDEKHSSSSSSKSKSSSSRHHSSHHHSSSSSSSHHSSKHERSSEKSAEKNGSSSNSSSSSKSSVTPNIHIISADKRLQNMKKKAAKTQESKRKK